jgi:hypothetical protein
MGRFRDLQVGTKRLAKTLLTGREKATMYARRIRHEK